MDSRGHNYVRDHMPKIGLGTYLIKDENELRRAIDSALKYGYRFVDTAQVYRNEAMVGRALLDFMPKYGLTRDRIFVTSKLDPQYNGPTAYAYVRKSVEKTGLGYIDLFLIHWPGKSGYRVQDKRNEEARQQAWRGLEQAYNEGLVRAIGVSNFQPVHLDQLMNYARVRPAINQCEFHPAYCPQDVLDSCRRHGVFFQAYSSFGGSGNVRLLEYENYKQLAHRYKCTTAQLLLAWSLSQGFSVLPKSVNSEHIRVNIKSLDIHLTKEDIERMKWSTEGQFCWNPRMVV